MKEIVYEGITFSHDQKRSLIEIDTAKMGVKTDAEFVIYYAKLQSYMKYKIIRYFVLVKKDGSFEISADYYKYRQSVMLPDILKKGIEQIFYLVSEEKAENYRKTLPDFVKVVVNYKEIDKFIKNQRNKKQDE